MNESIIIRKWLTEHDLISVAGICKKLKPMVDPGNFHRDGKAGKEMKSDVLVQIKTILKDYGYQEPAGIIEQAVPLMEQIDDAWKKMQPAINKVTKDVSTLGAGIFYTDKDGATTAIDPNGKVAKDILRKLNGVPLPEDYVEFKSISTDSGDPLFPPTKKTRKAKSGPKTKKKEKASPVKKVLNTPSVEPEIKKASKLVDRAASLRALKANKK